MPSFNKCIFLGNLTRDPQLKYLPNQTAVVEFGIAVNHKFKTAGGEDREDVMFLDCSCFGKRGEVINQYFTKGKPILVEGRLKYDQWEDKQGGGKRSKHSLVVEQFTFVGGDKPEQQERQPYPRTRQSITAGANLAPAQPFPPDDQQFKEDDIPFARPTT